MCKAVDWGSFGKTGDDDDVSHTLARPLAFYSESRRSDIEALRGLTFVIFNLESYF